MSKDTILELVAGMAIVGITAAGIALWLISEGWWVR